MVLSLSKFLRLSVLLITTSLVVGCGTKPVAGAPIVPATMPVSAVIPAPLAATQPVVNFDIVYQHRQLYDWSCIPMSIELVLKLTGREPSGYFELQNAWQNKMDGNFKDFEGRELAGLKFRQQFTETRGPDFPLDALFKTIDAELDHGRFVIISLREPASYHMYVIVGRTAGDEYQAVSKAGNGTLEEMHVKRRVRSMGGTDIMTYAVVSQ